MGFKDFLANAGLVNQEISTELPSVDPAPVEEVDPEAKVDLVTFYADKGFPVPGVFQLQTLMATLPPALTDAQKVQTVASILMATGFDLVTLLKDGSDRTTALQGYVDSLTAASDQSIKESTDAIASLQAEIARYQDEIQKTAENTQAMVKLLMDEVAKIGNITKPFLATDQKKGA